MSRAIYKYQFWELRCDEEYIGETLRTFGERYKEHLKEPSPIYGQSSISGHSTNTDNFTIIGREDQGLGMWVSITFTIYGTESCSAPLSLELIMIKGMHTYP